MVKKRILGFLFGMVLSIPLFAETDTIPASRYMIDTVSSQTVSDPFTKALDGNTSTWWAVNTAVSKPLPAVVVLDLQETYKVCGVQYVCNPQNFEDKLSAYEIFVSQSPSEWGAPQAKGRIYWDSSRDVAGKRLAFGAVEGRYVKIVYADNSNTWNNAIQTAELRVLQDAAATELKKNQYLLADSLPSLVNALDTTLLKVSASSSLPVSFRHVSGPASLVEKTDGTYLVCNGEEGNVVIEAYQEGNGEYYPASQRFSLQIQNPDNYSIALHTPIVESEPLVIPSDTLGYLLQGRAEIGSAFNRITDMYFTVEDRRLETRFNPDNGLAQAMFFPVGYGKYKIGIHATASNGSDTVVTRFLTVDSARETRMVRTFDELLINYPDPGRTNGGVYVFPQHQGSYWRIKAKLDVQCPQIPGGCDDWDRVGWIEIQTPDGQWREIIRYTTAFGKACSHELDVTDFSSWLQGEVPMRMFVDTWGTGGYSVTLDFEFTKGTPQYLYTTVTPLWNGNFPFGDMANLQPLDTLSVSLAPDAAALNLKVVTTGHGWGKNNSQNAAEFYHAFHHLYVDEEVFEQDLLMDCNPNPDGCNNQYGTWTYDRAGWCPGAIAPGYNFNATSHVGKDRVELKYIFEEGYVDYCHPNNPECVSGQTCADCFETYNPQYYIASYLVSYFDKMYDTLPYDTASNEQVDARRGEMDFHVYPNPVQERFFVQTYGETGAGWLQVISQSGEVVRNRVFNNGQHLNGMEIPVGDLPAGMYFVRIQTRDQNGIRKIVIQ